MPRTAGVYALPAGSIVTDLVDEIEASQHNVPLQDIAADLNAARPVSSGGTGATTAVAARANLEVYANGLRWTYGGTANAVTITSGLGISGTIPTGLRMRFRASAANTGATTIALDGGAAIACRTVTGVALPAGYIRTDADTVATFDGTFWVLDREHEVGSNPNGTFERFATGLMIVEKTLSGIGPVSFALGGDFISAAATIGTLAATFVAAPTRQITPWSTHGGAAGVLAGQRAGGTSGGNFTLIRPTADLNTTYGADCTFRGSWY